MPRSNLSLPQHPAPEAFPIKANDLRGSVRRLMCTFKAACSPDCFVRHGSAAVKEPDWIAITDGRSYADKPHSPHGDTVYVTSNRTTAILSL